MLGRGGWLAGLTLAKDGFPEEVTSQLSPEGCWGSQVTVLQRGTVFVQSWSPGDRSRGWCRAHRGGKGLRTALSGYAGTDYETKESGLGVLEGFFPSEKVKNELEGDKGGAGRSVGLMSGARWDTVASLGAVAGGKEETRVALQWKGWVCNEGAVSRTGGPSPTIFIKSPQPSESFAAGFSISGRSPMRERGWCSSNSKLHLGPCPELRRWPLQFSAGPQLFFGSG